MMEPVQNRYDFVLIFDVKDGNPNGDPDAGNLPRIDPETGHGLVTDVCLKRKVRNYVQLVKGRQKAYDIYVKEKAVLGQAHSKAFDDLGISTGQESTQTVNAEVAEKLTELNLPDGLSFLPNEENGGELTVAGDADKKAINAWLKDEKPEKKCSDAIKKALKDAKPRRPTAEETIRGREKMCEDYFDIRTFGAVMSLKSAPNCGQVRGPLQLTFGRSVDPVVTLEHSITRMAVATEAEAEKQQGDNRTMGRKATVPYGAYVAHGFVSAHLAAQTGFSGDDLNLVWDALVNMFDHDRSAARGEMATQKLILFKHDSALGNAPAHKLFDLVTVRRRDVIKPPRSFADYDVLIHKENIPSGVTLIEKT